MFQFLTLQTYTCIRLNAIDFFLSFIEIRVYIHKAMYFGPLTEIGTQEQGVARKWELGGGRKHK